MRLARGGNRILDGLSLTAPEGQITALLGPNGAGKTSTIRCCTTLLTPDSGTVQLFGQRPDQAVAAGLVGVMPQSVGAWSGIRPLELLSYLAGLAAHPLPVGALATELGIDRFSGTPYRRLSGGQQQLVNLAGALIGRPALVLLDEPTAGLDPHVRRQVWSLLERLRSAGVSMLLTTHAMDEAQALADGVHIIDAGRVVLSGPVAELTAERSLEDVFLTATRPEGR
ncbi:ABC transporter ATP-binding protein [Enemella dayhoffiae]|uniref:ABC transporter ATP-binding protein n=1 Tax=Enemella dayhoffiae TaxID=2016507 RepID=A0A255H6J2_9ACTN|nr:ABC transporter ATP-binding protein [Enemella dayhoffiae]